MAGLVLLSGGRPGESPRSAPASVIPTPLGSVAPLAPPSPAVPVAPPVSLTIPEIGVRTSLIHLGITRQGTLQVPSSTSVAGWYTGSPRPGEIGSSVIAGHIDSYRGPGVFFRLIDLRPGNLVYVRRADGSLVMFTVTAVHMYAKSHFPTAEVYGPAPDAELNLITCGGTFDDATHNYLSNVVVYTTQVQQAGSTPVITSP